MSITFETKLYENDYTFILDNGGKYLKECIKRCGINFNCRQLIINNVKNRKLIEEKAAKFVKNNVIDVYYFVEDYIEECLNFFGITRESFGKGFVYSISELVGIYLCKTDYLLHFSSDAFPYKNVYKSNWINEFINLNQKNSEYICSSLTWNKCFKAAKKESCGKLDNFFIAQGFTDLCYIIRNEVFRNRIYEYKNEKSERYPEYGGELFEKRIDAFMRTEGKYRLINNKYCYRHANFPKSNIKRFFAKLIVKINPFSTLFREPNNFKLIWQKMRGYI